MPRLLSARTLRRTLEIFGLVSVLGLVATLVIYRANVGAFFRTLLHLQWGWVVAAVGLASLDWFGGGLRLWVALRHVYPEAPLKGSIIAGGFNTWGSYLTPSQTGGGPFMIWALTRHQVPLPAATISTFITFVGTVVFFSVAGPIAIVLGAGRSLAQHGIPIVNVSLYDLFKASIGMFLLIGAAMLVVVLAPTTIRNLVHGVATRVERRRPALGHRIDRLRDGIDEARDALVKFFRGRGWLALLGTVLLSPATHANKLLAGYVVLRTLGIHANFTDVLLVQILIAFLLYFAPTPGGSGAAELLSAALMSIYIDDPALRPSYTMLWRLTTSYLTVATGSLVFWRWVRGGLIGREEAVTVARPWPEA